MCAARMKEILGPDSERVVMVPSGTAALEMAALLADLKEGDEVIMPSYTFSSTANAFVLRGAVPVFIDVRPDTFNIDEKLIEQAITSKTKAICAVHYGGVPCEMDTICAIAAKHNIFVIEDAAQGMFKYRVFGTTKSNYLTLLTDVCLLPSYVMHRISVDLQGPSIRHNRRLWMFLLPLY